MTTLHDSNSAWPVSALCNALSIPRSRFYYRSHKRDEKPLKQAIQSTAGAWPRYGSERIAAQMKREGVTFADKPVGERRVRRLMKEMGLAAKPHPKKKRTTDSRHSLPRFPNLVKDLTITHPDQVWVSDITYIALGSGFVYLAVLRPPSVAAMDVFTRSIHGWFLSRRLDGDLTLMALNRALATAAPQIHHSDQDSDQDSDQGGQYAATEYVAVLQNRGVTVSMGACSRRRERVGCPEENGYAERLVRTLKEEHLSLSEYRDFQDARSQIGQFIETVYQTKRIHSALGYLTPAEFETVYRANEE